MTNLAASNRNLTPQAPADVAQVTLLVDKSGSMRHLGAYVRDSIETVLAEFQDRQGAVLAVRVFNHDLHTVSEFGAPVPSRIEYGADGGTALYAAVAETIRRSREDAALTPEIKTHHVIVVVTNGNDEDSRHCLGEAQAEIDGIDVEATFLMIDFSYGGQAGLELGLRGVHIQDNTPAAFKEAMGRVRKALGQIVENVVKQLPPQTNLCLPPAR